MRSQGVGLAHLGRKRENNEDCWLADDQVGLYVVADGMGGRSAGDVASALAIDAAAATIRGERELIERVAAGQVQARELMPTVDRAVREASRAVLDRAAADPALAGMGCTLTLFLVAGDRGIMAHVGDSRLYLVRKGQLHQLSQDQTIAAELAREGAIPPEAVKTSPFRNQLSQSIGRPGVRPDLLRIEVAPGDRLLLCSDGLSNYITDPAWLGKKLQEEDLEGIPEELVRFANDAGGADNITALVVEVGAEPNDATLAAAAGVHARMEAIGACFLCADLTLARQARILSYGELTEHAPGAVVQQEGAPLRGLTLIVQGSVTLTKGGKPAGALKTGEHFGASALLRPRPARATLTATGKTSTLTLTPEALRDLSRRRPRLGLILQRRVARELAAALEERLQNEPRPHPSLAP